MFCFYTYGFSWDTILVFAVFMILLTITMIDFDTMTIPNGLIISLIVPVGIFTVLHPETALMTRAIGFFIVSLPMYLLTLLIPDCFGGGDIKLMAVSGAFLGTGPVVCAMFFGLLTGGAYGAFMLKSKKLGKKDVFAFGPFLAFGLALAALYGDQIVTWYLHFL